MFICMVRSFRSDLKAPKNKKQGFGINPQSVVYQGRILVPIITLMPALIGELKQNRFEFLVKKLRCALLNGLRKDRKIEQGY